MKMKFCVVSLFTVLSAGSVWADAQPGMPAPGATNGVIVDQGGSLHYQAQPSMENGQQPPKQAQEQQAPEQQPMTPNTPGMSATQPTPSMH